MTRILALEDDPDITELLRVVLGRAGHDVDFYTTGAEALDGLAREHYDAAVLDWGVPPPDGLAVCAALRTDARNSDCRVVMATARSTMQDRALAHAAGADDYLPKPYNARELVSRIDALIAERSHASS